MKKYKTEHFHIKLSTTFIARAKCKYCNDFSSFSYRIRNPPLHRSVGVAIKKFEYIRDSVKRMCDDYYMEFSPKVFTSAATFSHDVNYKGYNPKLHRTKFFKKDLNFTEYVYCKCGMTSWAFNYKSTEKQLQSKKRSNRVYPKKFTY